MIITLHNRVRQYWYGKSLHQHVKTMAWNQLSYMPQLYEMHVIVTTIVSFWIPAVTVCNGQFISGSATHIQIRPILAEDTKESQLNRTNQLFRFGPIRMRCRVRNHPPARLNAQGEKKKPKHIRRRRKP